MPAFPTTNIELFYKTIYGGFGYDGYGWGEFGIGGVQAAAFIGIASGITQGINPPYTVNDFLAMYPKFFGSPTSTFGTLVEGQSNITIDSTAGISGGQLIVASGLQDATIIMAVASPTSITVSAPATASGIQQLTIYEVPIVPLVVIQVYVNLAMISLMQSRWRGAWHLAMSLFVAHYCTLYAQTDGNPQSTASQIVANSLQAGVLVSQSADGVAMAVQPLEVLQNWGTWSLTAYGAQLATMARAVGAGLTYLRA